MHAHVHKEFFRNQDVSPSPRLFFSFSASSPLPPSPLGVASVSGAVIYHPPPGVATGGGGKKSCRAKTIISARAKRALLSLFSFFSFSFSSPSLRLATFLRFPALSSVSRRGRERERRNVSPTRVH